MPYHTTLVKKVLSNGLTVIVDPINHLPQVAIQLSYHVGSKDEKSGEKGLAHLIEHMLFKGTQRLSETDVAAIAHKLSGTTNAFTTHDSTGYTFLTPSGNWKEVLKIYADCMVNARFDEQMLNSELKAVIQELKMRKDRYQLSLIESLISQIFHDHPYHYPIIGFKQDLWNLQRDTLYNFYKKHYVPNNAVLVVSGDVNAHEVFSEAEKLFEPIKADESYKKETFYHGQDLMSRQVTLYRDVKLPDYVMTFELPGVKDVNRYTISFLEQVLSKPKTGRLSRKIVEELKLAPYVYAFAWKLEDATLFFIGCEPYTLDSVSVIKDIIFKELHDIAVNGLTDDELQIISRAIKIANTAQLESFALRAHAIAEGFMLLGDEQNIFTFADYPLEKVNENVKTLIATHFNQSCAHYGCLKPLTEQDKARWVELQTLSDQEDFRILEGKTRTSAVEDPRVALEIIPHEPSTSTLPLPEKVLLNNGVKLFYYDNKATNLVNIYITFKARTDYDHPTLYGLHNLMSTMLVEGTNNYPGDLFVQECQKYGISIGCSAGTWVANCLPEDLSKALELINELLTNVNFESQYLEKIREQIRSTIVRNSEEPAFIVSQAIEQECYKGHPWSHPALGTLETIEAISIQDIKDFYSNVITHDGMRISIAGNLTGLDIPSLVEKYVGNFKRNEIEALVYPELPTFEPRTLQHYLNRDQVTLAYFCRSIRRTDPAYDSYALFQSIFGVGMNSRLFQLRQRSGLFYSIYGVMSVSADIEPGYFLIQTQVSQDRVQEAHKVIQETINTVVDTLTEQELEDAKKMLITQKINSYATNININANILHNDRFELGDDYNRGYADRINAITLQDLQAAVGSFLNTAHMSIIEVGRI